MSGPLSSSSHVRSCTLLPVERGSFLFFISIRRFYEFKLENENLCGAYLYTGYAYSKTELESQGDDRSLERHCGQGNRPMSFRGVKRRGNPLNRNKNRLTIATNRISPRAYYRAENLRYQFEQGQELLPQLRQIICLVKVGRDTHTRLNYILPLVILSNAEESRRKPHFATLDSSLRYSQQLCLCIETYGFRL